MLVACSKCKTKYNIPAEMLSGAILKVRCKKCGHVFGVRKKEPPPEETVLPPLAAEEESGAPRDDTPPAREETPPEDVGIPPTPEEEPPPPPETAGEEPEEAAPALPEPASELPSLFDDFNLDDLAGSQPPREEPAPELEEPPSLEEEPPLALPEEEPSLPEEEPAPETGEFTLPDEAGPVAGEEVPAAEPGEEETAGSLSFDDFSLDDLAETPQPSMEEGAAPEEDFSDERKPPPDLDSPSNSLDLGGAGEDELKEGGLDLSAGDGENLSFDDFNLDDLAGGEKPPEEKPKEEAAPDFSALRKHGPDETDLGNLDLSDFTSGDLDFDLNGGEDSGFEASETAKKKDEPEEPFVPPSAEDFAKGLQELDLGAFDEKEEELLRVDRDELLSSSAKALDEKGQTAAVVAKPKLKMPKIPWGKVALAVFLLSAVGFTGFNILTRPEAAFSLVNPSVLKKIFALRDMQKKLTLLTPQEGSYIERDDQQRLYVVTGYLKNNTQSPVGAVKVEASVYDAKGSYLGGREAYCGNLAGKDELTGLPVATLLALIERQVGEGFSNYDIPPGEKVACMVVFQNPPEGIERYALEVVSFANAAPAGAPATAPAPEAKTH